MGLHLHMPVVASTMVRVRLSPEDRKALARLAKDRKTTESAVLREGIRLQERARRRRDGMQGLIDMIEGPEPKTIRWRPKY